jgi:hypothetical protein
MMNEGMLYPNPRKEFYEIIRDSIKDSVRNNEAAKEGDVHSLKGRDPQVPVIVSSSNTDAAPKKKANGSASSSNDAARTQRPLISVGAAALVESGRELSLSTLFGKLSNLLRAVVVRSEAPLTSVLAATIGSGACKTLVDVLKGTDIPVCPVPVRTVQMCAHAVEGLTLSLASARNVEGLGHVSASLATVVNCLLGLQCAIKKHKETYRKYYLRTSPSYRMQRVFLLTELARGGGRTNEKLKGNTGGKELLGIQGGESSSLLSQPPWVCAEIQMLSSALDEAFFRVLSCFGDVLSQFSYSSENVEELKLRLSDWSKNGSLH